MRVKERLLFDGIALHSGGVAPGDIERSTPVEADFADAGLTFGNGTLMTARETANAVVFEFFVESGVGLADSLVEHISEGGHKNLLGVF
jgi:hypothetical protein